MTYEQFKGKLREMDLVIRFENNGQWSIKSKYFANPLLFFNPSLSDEDYFGNVNVKAYNIGCYSSEELRSVLLMVNDLLLTKLSERGELINSFK